jgi:methylenetetrahydrofolate reductase (NADPH)
VLRANGFEPVLHVAARYFATHTELVGYLARAGRETGAENMLIIGGDADRPNGEFASALSLIESGLLSDYGIRRIGVAGYPDGYPKISSDALIKALGAKIETALASGIAPHITTQFCFEAIPILAWLKDIRERWPDVPVKLGVAGPTGLKTLLKFAVRCGVNTPRTGLAQKLPMASKIAEAFAPGDLLDDLDTGLGQIDSGTVSAHFFSFGGLEKTASWIADRLAEGSNYNGTNETQRMRL